MLTIKLSNLKCNRVVDTFEVQTYGHYRIEQGILSISTDAKYYNVHIKLAEGDKVEVTGEEEVTETPNEV